MHRNRASHPITLASGQPLAPGEDGDADMRDDHDKALRDAGHLLKVDEPDTADTKKKGEAK